MTCFSKLEFNMLKDLADIVKVRYRSQLSDES